MKTIYLKGLGFALLLSSLFFLSGCGGEITKNVLITMKNSSSESIHLWTSGESMDPSNKVAPGASRNNFIPWIQRDGEALVAWVEVTIYAGSNGVVLTSKTIRIMVQETGSASVVYSGGVLTEK